MHPQIVAKTDDSKKMIALEVWGPIYLSLFSAYCTVYASCLALPFACTIHCICPLFFMHVSCHFIIASLNAGF